MSSWNTLGIALVIAVGLAPNAYGATDDQKCAAKKIKAAGKKVFDKARCHQKATLKGTAVDQACLDKAEDKFNLQIAKADVIGTCGGTAAGMEAHVDVCVATLLVDVFPPAQETDCSNLVDDDGDGDIDCFDPDCAADPTQCGPESVCDDGFDNDADGAIDCDDPDCNADPALCAPPMENAVPMGCQNGQDDDLDGNIDCFDADCAAEPPCSAEFVCDDGLDNDADGATDCVDSDCIPDPVCAP